MPTDAETGSGDHGSVRWSREGRVAAVTIFRPERKNAIDGEAAAQMAVLLDELSVDDETRAIVIRGYDDTFCAGGDVRKAEGRQRTARERMEALAPYHRLTTVLANYPKPVVAAVDGVAFGAGFSLALLADFIVVSDRARFCMAFQRIGLVPDLGAMYSLPRAIGLQRAKELLLSGREVSAAEAREMGLAVDVVEPAALFARALQLAESLSQASPVALACTKAGLAQTFTSDLQSMLSLEAAGQAIATDTEYFREAVRRLAAKERPQFKWPLPDGG